MMSPTLHRLNRGFRRILADYPTYKVVTVFLPLLLLPFLAPACAPNEPPPANALPQNLVLLTDTARWQPGHLAAYKDSLVAAGYRVLVSGYRGESAAELSARLPWLLQPGVDLFLYDDRLAGQAGADSLTNYLKVTGHPALVQKVER